ncbi:hypothetical protein Ancab_013665 [Ancistrocladus abbreviatus]
MRPSVAAAVLVIALLIEAGEGFFIWPVVDLRMINRLDSKAILRVHCYKDGHHDPGRDLGEHCLHEEEYYEVHFRPNFWGTTHYPCSFTWNGITRWFYVYYHPRDRMACVPQCWWYIKERGPCMMHPKVTHERDTGLKEYNQPVSLVTS